MTPQPKNMNELMNYLTTLEQRIETLEKEKSQLQKRTTEKKLPETNLLSQKFLTRAFAIWGHFMTANFIISGILTIITYCILFTLFGSFLQSISQSIPTPAYTLPTIP